MKGVVAIICLVFISNTECACTFPTSLEGTWITSGQGTWIVNSTHIQDFKTISDSGRQVTGITPFTTLTFECHENMGDTKYVIKNVHVLTDLLSETFELFVGAFESLYICLDLREISTEKYIFYKATEEDSNGDQFTLLTSYTDVCNSASYELPYRYRVALKSGSETSALIQCPPAIFGTYTYNTCTDTNSNTTSMDVCDSRQQLIYNYTLCNTPQMFSLEGVLDCVYFASSGSVTYLTVYNRDNTATDEVSYFRFTCMALALSGNDVLMTVYPERCLDNQNTATIASPGYAVHFVPFYLCPLTSDEESSSTNILLFIIAGIAAFLLTALTILLIYCCCCRRRRKKDDEESVNESDSESETSISRPASRHDSRRSSQASSKSSIDSGIDGVSPRSQEEVFQEGDGEEKVTEVIMTSEGEKEVEVKTSRPSSRQLSRMSDLPPSTIPEEDEGTHRDSPEEEQVRGEDDTSVHDDTTVTEEQTEEDTKKEAEENDPPDNKEEEKDSVKGDENEDSESEHQNNDINDEQVVSGENEDNSSIQGATFDQKTKDVEHDKDDESEEDTENNKIKGQNEENVTNQDEESEDEQNNIEKDKSESEKTTNEIDNNQVPSGENEGNTNSDENSKETENTKEEHEVKQTLDTKSEHEFQDEKKETQSIVSDTKGTSEQMDEEEHRDVVVGESQREPSEHPDSLADDDNENVQQSEHPDSRADDDNENVQQSEHPDSRADDDNENVQQSEHPDSRADDDNERVQQSEHHDSRADDDDNESVQQSEHPESRADDDNESVQQSEHESYHGDTRSHGDDDRGGAIIPVPTEDQLSNHEKNTKHNEKDNRHLDDRHKESVKEEDSEDDQQPVDNRAENRVGNRDRDQRNTDGEGPHTSDSEYERKYRSVGLKGGHNYMPSGSLTTVLVSRHEEEKKRLKMTKTKKQRMTKLARDRTRVFGVKGDHHNREDGDDVMFTDEELGYDLDNNTKFMQQYRHKKRIEHILDEQHYWSDPDEDHDRFGPLPSESSLMSSDYDSDEYEIVVGADGLAKRVRKTNRIGHGEELDTEKQRGKQVRGTGPSDNLADVEQPENVNESNSKKKLHGTGDAPGDKDDQTKTGAKHGITHDSHKDEYSVRKDGANARVINVKERPGFVNGADKRYGNKGRVKDDGSYLDDFSDFCDTDFGKISDDDSGLSDGEEAVDVILSHDQQQMIVNMLFDEDMNLRPQFDRDENGRIVRRLDNTVIYDPHTGRFTYIKRLGQLFKVARLKRNAKGRPTGGYIEDDYGPREMPSAMTESAKRGRTASSKSSSDMASKSPSADQKRSRPTDGKNVGFVIPEDDAESMSTDQLEYNKRGRRDIGSSIRKTLSRRLFRKKRKRGTQDVSSLPELQLNRSWTGDSMSLINGGGDARLAPPGGVNPYNTRYGGRSGPYNGTPGQQRRMTGSNDPEQLQKYREGLQSDRRILDSLQDKLNSESDADDNDTEKRPWETKLAFMEPNGQDDLDADGNPRQHEDLEHSGHGCQFYKTYDGRLGIRERGCPELKPHTQQQQRGQLFTIVRRPGDLEKEEHERELQNAARRNVHTAPVILQSTDTTPRDQAHAQNSQDSLHDRESYDSRMTSIDDNRLRRLLEELYRDKKYFDYYIDSTEPKSDAIVHSKGLAEHGRGYLLERANYWERRGPLPPRPPQTAAGWRMQRQQTQLLTREGQMQRASTTMTYTPTEESLPGTIDSPRNEDKDNSMTNGHANNNGDLRSDDKVLDDTRSRELKESEA